MVSFGCFHAEFITELDLEGVKLLQQLEDIPVILTS